jgi:UDP:flavonoid glycosyltransferase YjiC (YdhE family)
MLPLGRDQHINADRVARLGAGIHLAPDAAPGRIRHALEELIMSVGIREAAAAAARIEADKPDQSALQAVETAGTKLSRR